MPVTSAVHNLLVGRQKAVCDWLRRPIAADATGWYWRRAARQRRHRHHPNPAPVRRPRPHRGRERWRSANVTVPRHQLQVPERKANRAAQHKPARRILQRKDGPEPAAAVPIRRHRYAPGAIQSGRHAASLRQAIQRRVQQSRLRRREPARWPANCRARRRSDQGFWRERAPHARLA